MGVAASGRVQLCAEARSVRERRGGRVFCIGTLPRDPDVTVGLLGDDLADQQAKVDREVALPGAEGATELELLVELLNLLEDLVTARVPVTSAFHDKGFEKNVRTCDFAEVGVGEVFVALLPNSGVRNQGLLPRRGERLWANLRRRWRWWRDLYVLDCVLWASL